MSQNIINESGHNPNTLVVISSSGGLDSTTLMAKALKEGYMVLPVNFNYGQKNIVEVEAQKNVIGHFKKKYSNQILEPLYLDFNLLFADILAQFKQLRDGGKIKSHCDLEFYMPFRNLVFSSIAAMVAEMNSLRSDIDIRAIKIGIGVHKHSSEVYEKDYWDITPKFVEQLQAIVNLNDAIPVSVYAPYAEEFKSSIITDAIDLDVPYKKTWTCYQPKENLKHEEKVNYVPCKVCEACMERELQGVKAGVDDINDYSVDIAAS